MPDLDRTGQAGTIEAPASQEAERAAVVITPEMAAAGESALDEASGCFPET